MPRGCLLLSKKRDIIIMEILTEALDQHIDPFHNVSLLTPLPSP
jgi:hypothetical protein